MRRKNRTNRLVFVFTTVLFFSLFSCKTQNVYTVNRIEQVEDLNQTTSKSIDDMHYNKDARMLYSIYNDDQYLYVVMSVTDRTIQKKILMGGLTFWMDTIAKKKEQFGITFPRAGSMKNSFAKMNKEQMMQQMQNGGMQQSMNYAELNQKFSNNLNDMEIVGFNNKKEPEIIFNQNANGINASIQFDEEGTLHYQADIPLKFVFNNPEEYLNNPNKVFSFGFETGAVDMPSMPSGGRPGGMAGGMAGGGMAGGMAGGGMRGGGMPGGMSGMQELSKASRFWVKTAHLSKQ